MYLNLHLLSTHMPRILDPCFLAIMYFRRYRSFLQRAGHCISKKPLNKDNLYEGVSQLDKVLRTSVP